MINLSCLVKDDLMKLVLLSLLILQSQFVSAATAISENTPFAIDSIPGSAITGYNGEFDIIKHEFVIDAEHEGLYSLSVRDNSAEARNKMKPSDDSETEPVSFAVGDNMAQLKAVLYKDNTLYKNPDDTTVVGVVDGLSQTDFILEHLNLTSGNYQLYVLVDDVGQTKNAIPYSLLVEAEGEVDHEFAFVNVARKKLKELDQNENNSIANVVFDTTSGKNTIYVQNEISVSMAGKYTLTVEDLSGVDWTAAENDFTVLFGIEDENGVLQVDPSNCEQVSGICLHKEFVLPNASGVVLNLEAGDQNYRVDTYVEMSSSQDNGYYAVVITDESGKIVSNKKVVAIPSSTEIIQFDGISLDANSEYKIEYTSLDLIELDNLDFSPFNEENGPSIEVVLQNVFAGDNPLPLDISTAVVGNDSVSAETRLVTQEKPITSYMTVTTKELADNDTNHYGFLLNIFKNVTPNESDESKVVWMPVYSNSHVFSPILNNGAHQVSTVAGLHQLKVSLINGSKPEGFDFNVLALGASGVHELDVTRSTGVAFDSLGGDYKIYPLLSPVNAAGGKESVTIYGLKVLDITAGQDQAIELFGMVDVTEKHLIVKGSISISEGDDYEIAVKDGNPISTNLSSNSWGVVLSNGSKPLTLTLGDLSNESELSSGEYQVTVYKTESNLAGSTLFSVSAEQVEDPIPPTGGDVVVDRGKKDSGGGSVTLFMWLALLSLGFRRK